MIAAIAAVRKWKDSLGLKENPVRAFFACWGLMFILLSGLTLGGMLIGREPVKPSLWYIMVLVSFLSGGLYWTQNYPRLTPAKKLSAKRHVVHFLIGYAVAFVAVATMFWIENGFGMTLDDGITFGMGAFVIAVIGKGSVYARSAASQRALTYDRRLDMRDKFQQIILRTARSYKMFDTEIQDVLMAPLIRALAAIEDRSLAGISFVTGLIHADYLHTMEVLGTPPPMIFQLYRQGVEVLNQPDLTDDDIAQLQSLINVGEEIIRENLGQAA